MVCNLAKSGLRSNEVDKEEKIGVRGTGDSAANSHNSSGRISITNGSNSSSGNNSHSSSTNNLLNGINFDNNNGKNSSSSSSSSSFKLSPIKTTAISTSTSFTTSSSVSMLDDLDITVKSLSHVKLIAGSFKHACVYSYMDTCVYCI